MPIASFHTVAMFTSWMGTPTGPEISQQAISFTAGGKTDFFRDPASDMEIANAPFFFRKAPQSFTLTVRLSPEFAATYDAGALLYYMDERRWAKLAYEQTDMGYPAVVSVVTRDRSDDCNGEPWSSGALRLRVSRRGGTIGFYYGAEGNEWKMKRLFVLDADSAAQPLIGIAAQSPTGEGCRVLFDELDWREESVANFRTGR